MRSASFIFAFLLLLSFGRAEPPQESEASPVHLRKLIADVGPCCLAAKIPSDLDSLYAKVSALSKMDASVLWTKHGLPLNEFQEFHHALYLMNQWREYLDALSKGNRTAAYRTLHNLMGNQQWLTLMPRSEVLSRYEKCYQLEFVSIPDEHYSDLPKAIDAILKFQQQLDNPDALDKQLKILQQLEKLAQNSQPREDEVTSLCNPDPNEDGYITNLKMLVLPFKVATALDLGKEYQLPPKEDEKAPDFLSRLNELALQQGDMRTLWKIRTYEQTLKHDPTEWDREQIECLDFCLYGRAKEAANQYNVAVIYYRSALHREAAPEIIHFISTRLEEIKKTFPEDYANGMNSPIFPRKEDARGTHLYGRFPSQPHMPGYMNDTMDPFYRTPAPYKKTLWKKY